MTHKSRGPHNVTPSSVSERSVFRRKWHQSTHRHVVKQAIRLYACGKIDPDDHVMPPLVKVGSNRYHRDED